MKPLTTDRAAYAAAIVLTLVLCWMTFYKLFGIRFTNSDDMAFSVISLKNYLNFSAGGHDAVATGRFGMYYAWLYYMITAAFWNTPLYDVAAYGSVAAVVIAILALSHYLGAWRLGLLFATLYLAFIPVTFNFNLLVSYPFRYTSGILLWLASLFLVEAYLRTKWSPYLWCSCVLSFVAFTHHETLFAIFASTNVLFVLVRQNSGTIKQRVTQPATLAVLGTALSYAGLFLTWYLLHPPTYEGNSIDFGARNFLSGYMAAIGYYVTASLPLFNVFSKYTAPYIDGGSNQFASIVLPYGTDLLHRFNAGGLFRSAIIMVMIVFSTTYARRPYDRSVMKGLVAVGAVTLILPCAIISLSRTYQVYVAGGYAPLHVTFFSYFGAIVILALLLTQLVSRTRGVTAYVVALVVGIGALLSNAANDQIAEIMQQNTTRWNAAAALIGEFTVRPAKAPSLIVAPQLWNYVGSPGPLPNEYWQRLVHEKTGLEIRFVPKAGPRMPNTTSTMYYLCPRPSDCLIILQHNNSTTADVIATSPRPRFLTYSESAGQKTVKVLPILESAPELLHPGIYSAMIVTPTKDSPAPRVEM